MAAPVIVTGDMVKSETTSVSTSLTCTKATNIVAGDLLLILAVNDPFDENDTFNTLSGWTQRVNHNTPADAGIGVWTRIATGDANDKDETISKTGTSENWSAWYMRITGAHATHDTAWDGAGTDVEDTAGGEIVVPGYTTTGDDVLVFCVVATDGGDLIPVTYSGTGWGTAALYESFNPASGDPPVGDAGGSGGSWLTRTVATGGSSTNSVTATASGNDGMVGIQFGIAPPAGALLASESVTFGGDTSALTADGALADTATITFGGTFALTGVTEFTQAAFRWGNDDNSDINQDDYTFSAAQDINLTQDAATPAILRYLVNTGGDTPATQLKLQVKRSTGPASEWRDVPVE